MVNPFDYFALASMREIQQYTCVDDYYTRVIFLRTFCLSEFPNICDEYFLSQFIKGLKQEIQVYVLQHHPPSLLDAYELALIQEYTLKCAKQKERKLENTSITAAVVESTFMTEFKVPEGPDDVDDPSVAGDCTAPGYALALSRNNEQIQDSTRGSHSSHFTNSSLKNDPPMEQCVLAKVLNSRVIETVLCNTENGVVEHNTELENSWPYTDTELGSRPKDAQVFILGKGGTGKSSLVDEGSPESATAAMAHIESVLESGMVNVTLFVVLSQGSLHYLLFTLEFLGFKEGTYCVHQYFLQDSAGMVHGTTEFPEALDTPLLIDTDSEYVVGTKYFANRKGADTTFSKSIMVVCVAKSTKNCYAQVLEFLLLPVMVAFDWVKALSGLAWGYSTSIQPCVLANFFGGVLWVIFPWEGCIVWNRSFTLKEEIRRTVQSFWPSLVEASFNLARLKEDLIEAEQTSPRASCTTPLKLYAQVEHISVQDSSETTLVPDFIPTHLGYNEVEAVSATLDPSLSHREEHTEIAERPSSGMLCAGIQSLIAESVICAVQSDAIRDSNVPDLINVVEPIISYAEVPLCSAISSKLEYDVGELSQDTKDISSNGESDLPNLETPNVLLPVPCKEICSLSPNAIGSMITKVTGKGDDTTYVLRKPAAICNIKVDGDTTILDKGGTDSISLRTSPWLLSQPIVYICEEKNVTSCLQTQCLLSLKVHSGMVFL